MFAEEVLLSQYPQALDSFYVSRIADGCRAQKPHFHDYFQIYFVCRGELSHYFGEESAVLGKGDLFLIPPRRIHYIGMEHPSECYVFSFQLSFFPPEFLQSSLGKFLQSLAAGKRGARPKVSLPPALRTKAEDLCALALDEFSGREISYLPALQGLLTALLSLLMRAYYTAPQFEKTARRYEERRQAILKVIDQMKKAPAAPLSLEQAARQTLMSRAQFCKSFPEIAGAPFHSYQMRLRIETAAALILAGDEPLMQIAELCGYRDYSSFYRNFSQVMGLSPSDYLRLCEQP